MVEAYKIPGMPSKQHSIQAQQVRQEKDTTRTGNRSKRQPASRCQGHRNIHPGSAERTSNNKHLAIRHTFRQKFTYALILSPLDPPSSTKDRLPEMVSPHTDVQLSIE